MDDSNPNSVVDSSIANNAVDLTKLNTGVSSEFTKQTPTMMKKIPKKKNNTVVMVVVSLFVVLAGVATGWMLSGGSEDQTGAPSGNSIPGATDSPTEAGIEDDDVFADTAEGELVVGSIEGEGTHYLERGAGDNKRVYLTSTVIDLESFTGKKVQVWGETIAAQNAPWLMDVGKIKVIE